MWEDLHAALLSRIFNSPFLSDAERCRVIPLVCKHWGTVHRDHAPERPAFNFRLPVHSSSIKWFLRVAGTVTRMRVTHVHAPADSLPPTGFLPQLLTAAAVSAPKLVSLTMPLYTSPVLDSLHMLSTLTMLHISPWIVEKGNDIAALSGLVSLRVGTLERILMPGATDAEKAAQAGQLWTSLGTLRSLDNLHVSFVNLSGADALRHVSCLTRIRRLGTDVPRGVAAVDSLARLTQLTALVLVMEDRWMEDPVRLLPNLKEALIACSKTLPVRPLLSPGQRLTSLCLMRTTARRTIIHEAVLPTALPTAGLAMAMGSLRQLGLVGLGLQGLPHPIMACLPNLQKLDLSRNHFASLPSPLTLLTSLKSLNMAGNTNFQLRGSDIGILKALPQLALLRLTGVTGLVHTAGTPRWSDETLLVLMTLTRQMPDLNVLPWISVHPLDCHWPIVTLFGSESVSQQRLQHQHR